MAQDILNIDMLMRRAEKLRRDAECLRLESSKLLVKAEYLEREATQWEELANERFQRLQ